MPVHAVSDRKEESYLKLCKLGTMQPQPGRKGEQL